MTVVKETRFSIEELATAAGLTRRGIRFYVQQGLIPPPHGVGRGNHYDQVHLDRLLRVRDLQSAGHSLDEIRQILAGGAVTPVKTAPRRAAAGPVLRAELWRRLRMIEGVELSFDAARFNPAAEDLLRLREALATVFTNENSNSKETP